ncbi:hypothetical protein [Streptomyces sp. SID13031]|uniref:hypothetical protein n=1 Tax=Streptomyces sp. SID13031 TaxID=2706046 RepID=UPI0013C6E1F6|nr:hypothetical protein [Streptomyces sp. SID13031]NEA31184.1 hypothetical protein [Streptomyces sp. SID13031]
MSDWYTERRQNLQLDELRDQMAATAYEASNLRTRLSQVQGSMETRLQRLTTAFDAFVELSDIRFDLIGFADAAEVRRHAGQVLSALASGETPPAAGRDVPAYWLGPAVEAVRSLIADAPDEAVLAEALQRDEFRTSIFLCLALAALGRRNEVRAQWLDTAFGKVADDGTVTRVQRALWTTAARGGFGIEGLTAVVTRLKVPGTAAAQRWATPVMERVARVLVNGPAFPEIATHSKARADLSRLRTAVAAIAGDTSVLEPDGDLAYVPGDKPDPDSTSAVLRLLISEGSVAERGALARVAELRTQITGGTATGVGAIDDPAGAIDKLLMADLRNTDEPHLAATALRVVSAGVLADAEALAQTARTLSPGTVSKEIEWRPVILSSDGPDRQSLAAAEAAISATVQPLSVRELGGPVAIAAAGLVVAVAFGLLLHSFWTVVGLVIIATAGYNYAKARKKHSAEQADAAQRIERLRKQADQTAAELAEYQAGHRDRVAAVTAELEELQKLRAQCEPAKSGTAVGRSTA